MRGDEPQATAADAEGPRQRRGPRHAAPRKSLLTKLQAPAGKALALAAMPTAVLMGMSLTPRPALADDKDIPFAPGPCVTQSDEPGESQEPTPSQSASPTKPSEPSADPTGTKEPTPGTTPSATPTPTPTPSSTTTTDPKTGTTPTPSTTPTPTPTPTETRNPLDPLGVGEAVKDFFGGLTGQNGTSTEQQPAAAEAPAPTSTPTPTAPAAQPKTEAEPPATPTPTAEPSSKPTSDPATKPVDDVLDKTKEAIKDAADKVGADVEELPEDVKGLDPKQDEDIPDGAKPRFPCPTPDPEALANAQAEPGIPHVPDDPWKLESTLLTLRGLKYHGIVEVETGSGKVKKVLKFTASEVDIKDLHQTTVHSEGRTGHVTSRPGSTSTMRNGTVTMYTEELKGNLFGIIPVTFSPETPPPLDVPFAFFTNAKVTQAGQFGGTLTVPGLHNFIKG
ncbi:hypothetical protein [Streptomyces sp. TRM64462]|uniref:hypothetical protein n=1 Tax=Streptomyces sp. TRM64462 TaxID=2741726 RepID=UPI001585EE58|nr:hypothetical protein [Streptomyces sp. TRM64462]